MLGLAFKGGTDDIRESPAIAIVQSLLQQGSKVTVMIQPAWNVLARYSGSRSPMPGPPDDSQHDALLILTNGGSPTSISAAFAMN